MARAKQTARRSITPRTATTTARGAKKKKDDSVTMQVKVTRKDNGDFLFVEANSDFVNMIYNLQQISIGSLVAMTADSASDNDNPNAIQAFRETSSNLPEHLLVNSDDGEGNKMPPSPLSLKDLLTEKPTPSLTIPLVEVMTSNMTCTSIAGRGGTACFTCTGQRFNGDNNNVAFRNLGDSFEVAITLPSNRAMMFGILPDDTSLQSKLGTCIMYKSYGFFLYLHDGNPGDEALGTGVYGIRAAAAGKEFKMRFDYPNHTLEYSYDDGGWIKATNIYDYGGIQNGTKVVPVIVCNHNQPFLVAVKSRETSDAVNTGIYFKKGSTFLVSKELEVADSSTFSSHVQLLQRYKVSNVLKLKTTTVNFGTTHLKQLINAILAGKSNVLEMAFCGEVIDVDNDGVAIKTEHIDDDDDDDDEEDEDSARPRKRRATTRTT